MLSTSTAHNKGQNKGEMTTYKGIVQFLKGGGALDVGERKRENRYKQLLEEPHRRRILLLI